MVPWANVKESCHIVLGEDDIVGCIQAGQYISRSTFKHHSAEREDAIYLTIARCKDLRYMKRLGILIGKGDAKWQCTKPSKQTPQFDALMQPLPVFRDIKHL